MHAHQLASPCSADELTKHLTELNGFRSMELDDAGGDRGTEEDFGTEVAPRLATVSGSTWSGSNLVPGDPVKRECGGLARADGEVLDGKIDTSEYDRSEWCSQN